MMTAQVQKFVEQIHTTPYMLVLEFTGAGTQALSWLHSVGGSSRTVLEAGDRYASTSLFDLIGFEPEQYTSLKVARAMASQAFMRAHVLVEAGTPVMGVGCTATIATKRQKRGHHRCCVAVCDAQGLTTYELRLIKGLRDRQAEEAVVSLIILQAIATACGLDNLPELPLDYDEALSVNVETSTLLDRLSSGDFQLLLVSPEGEIIPRPDMSHIAVLSGAFNPLHVGHRKMAEVVAKQLGQEVYFELPLVNADKSPIDAVEAQSRISQFANFAPLILSARPLFNQKSKLFPNSIFILGADTTQRLLEPRFYEDDAAKMLAAFDEIRRAGCRFLVASRLYDGQFLTLSNIALPAGYSDLFEEIPSHTFRMDISSTVLRGLPS